MVARVFTEEDELLLIGLNTALVHAAASLVIPLIALRFVVGWDTIRSNLVYVYLSILGCVVPYLALASVNYEFPALLGGLIGTVASVALARLRVGLTGEGGNGETPRISARALIKAAFPLWGAVAILVVTRIEQLGVKGFLIDGTPVVEGSFGSFAHFGASASLVLRLDRIFDAESTWVMQVLYIPALVPFFAVSLATFWLFRMRAETTRDIARSSYDRMKKPIITLSSALIMVQLLMVGGEESIVVLIEDSFAEMIDDDWICFASFLGALGSFFSGSATISNLTFGGIQNSIAASLGLDRTVVLALQSVGGAMGNMVCINIIVAVSTILGIINREGYILKRTLIPMLAYGLVAGLSAVVL
jgi:lactate permease